MGDTLLQQVRNILRQVRLVRENRRLERDLRLRLAHLEQIHRQIPEAIFATISSDHHLSEINPQARELLGVPEEEALEDRPIGEVLGLVSEELADLVKDLLARDQPARNLYVESADSLGGDRLLLLNLDRVCAEHPDDEDDEAAWVLTLRDVTPSRRDAAREGTAFHGIVGRDERILEVCDLVRRVAPLPTSVLITGPTGSGKEVVARAIHAASDRSGKPFIPVNCTALSREILESELFGHVRGAFTGAVTARKGRFREADGGTLFLDEIGDTSESFQTKLLRSLETGEIEPVGQDRPINVDVRIICATNQDLGRRVREGRFREDLFYRINVVRIDIPPLSERPGDLPLLIDLFRRELNERFKKSIRFVSRGAMRVLARHDWPGNVRELRHVLEHAFVVADGPAISLADLPSTFSKMGRQTRRRPPASPTEPVYEAGRPESAALDENLDEASRIKSALGLTGGNIGKAADRLKMHRATLWRKMRRHRIQR